MTDNTKTICYNAYFIGVAEMTIDIELFDLVIEKLLPYLQSTYIDFKLFDEESHKFYTGVSNQRIKENVIRTDTMFTGDIHIRIPTIQV